MPEDTPVKGQPSWITSAEGPHPLADLKANPVTPEELEAARWQQEIRREEAMEMWAGKGRAVMTDEQKFRAMHETRADLHRRNLELFEEQMRTSPAQRNVIHVLHHAKALAQALLHLGEFDQAMEALDGIQGAEVDHLRSEIQAWKVAEEIPDGEDCKCPPPSTDEHIDERNSVIALELEAPKRFRAGEYFSKRLGRLANIHRCGVCGHSNGHADESERHAQRLQLRQAAEHNVRVGDLAGGRARAHLEALGHHGDRTHLATEKTPTPQMPPSVISQ